MNARRIPFQFSTTDPVARQKELEKRFGLQSTCPKMYVDVNNPLSMGTPKEISSPRLQHRVPIFAEGYDHPIHSSSVDSMSSIPEKKPNVRVIPIEVEGDVRSPRHRTYSGPAGNMKDRCEDPILGRTEIPPFKRLNVEDVSKHAKPKLRPEPKVFNIPIQVEGADNTPKSPKIYENKSAPTPKPASATPTANGCAQSKLPKQAKSPSKIEVKVESTEKEVKQPPENPIETVLKKIEDVLKEFKTYETGVVEFTGTSKDKQYRYLDEMLTRCMLKLDDIDTMGNEEIRLARKNAVKKIQASIDLLESKANVQPVTTCENQLVPDENTEMQVDMQDKTVEDNAVVSTGTVCDNGESKVSESSENETKPSDEVEPVKTEEKSNVMDVEMHEIAVSDSTSEATYVDDSKSSNIPEDTVQTDENSTLQLQSNVPEVEMSEETSPSDAQSSDDKCVKQDADVNDIVSSDVEMTDEKDLTTNSVEKPQVSEVEMGDISSQECCDKKESDSETVNDKSQLDCVKEQTVSNVALETAELSEVKSETSQPVDDSQNVEK